MYPIYYRAVEDFPHLGLWEGDIVRYDPTGPNEITVARHLPPNHGALLNAVESGFLTQIDGVSSSVSRALHPQRASSQPSETKILRFPPDRVG